MPIPHLTKPDPGREHLETGSPLSPESPLPFRCAGCGSCCRGRRDLLLSGYDLYRLAVRLDLPPEVVAEGVCDRYTDRLPRPAGPAAEGHRRLPVPCKRALRRPRRPAARLRPLPAGADDHAAGGDGFLFYAGRPVRRKGVRTDARPVAYGFRHCGAGTD